MAELVSIIVPTFNGSKKIVPCIEALLSIKSGRSYEIIVVDDGSTDDTREIIAKFPEIIYLYQENSGPAVARNNGANKANGEIVVFTDDDCIPEPDWLDELLKPFSDPQIVASKGAYLTRQKELTAQFVQAEYEEKYEELLKKDFIDFIDTYSAAFRKDVFLSFGGYDSSFTVASAEDQELAFRIANAGHKMVFAPRARVFHTHIDSPKGYLLKKYKNGFWKALVIKKNPNKATGDDHTPQTQKIQIGLTALFLPALIVMLLLPDGMLLSAVILAFYLLSAIPLILRSAEKSLILGLVSPVFILLRSIGLTAGLTSGVLNFYILKK